MIDAQDPVVLIILGLISGGVITYLLKIMLPELDSQTKKWDCLLDKYSDLNKQCENRLQIMEEKVEKLEKKLKQYQEIG